MGEAPGAPKNPAAVELGRRGARRRWGEPRHLKLADLDPATRTAILALVEADQAARTAAANLDGSGSGQDAGPASDR